MPHVSHFKQKQWIKQWGNMKQQMLQDTSASASVYERKKALSQYPDHSSSAHRKSDSNLKDII